MVARLFVLGWFLMLASCANGFRDHWNLQTPSEQLSWAAKVKTFRVLDEYSNSAKVRYNYGMLPLGFSSNESYADSRDSHVDFKTSFLISESMQEMGYKDTVDGELEFTYAQLLGWDMGEIVKRMKICVASANNCECAEFSEMTMMNSQPKRQRVVRELLAILMTTELSKGARGPKYQRTQCSESNK
jgi:hypothetical protein